MFEMQGRSVPWWWDGIGYTGNDSTILNLTITVKLLKSTTFCFLTRCVIVISCKRKETYWGKVDFCKYMMKRKIYQQCCVYYVNPVEAKAPFQVKPTFWGGLTDRPGHPPVLLSGGNNPNHWTSCGMMVEAWWKHGWTLCGTMSVYSLLTAILQKVSWFPYSATMM